MRGLFPKARGDIGSILDVTAGQYPLTVYHTFNPGYTIPDPILVSISFSRTKQNEGVLIRANITGKTSGKVYTEAVPMAVPNNPRHIFLETKGLLPILDSWGRRVIEILETLHGVYSPKKDNSFCTPEFWQTTVEEIISDALLSLSICVLNRCPHTSSLLNVGATQGDIPFTIYRTFYSDALSEDNVRVRVTFARNAEGFITNTEIVGERTGKVYLEDSLRRIPDNTHKVLHETYRIAELLRAWEDSLVSLLTKKATEKVEASPAPVTSVENPKLTEEPPP